MAQLIADEFLSDEFLSLEGRFETGAVALGNAVRLRASGAHS